MTNAFLIAAQHMIGWGNYPAAYDMLRAALGEANRENQRDKARGILTAMVYVRQKLGQGDMTTRAQAYKQAYDLVPTTVL